jgi:hypothetical protein
MSSSQTDMNHMYHYPFQPKPSTLFESSTTAMARTYMVNQIYISWLDRNNHTPEQLTAESMLSDDIVHGCQSPCYLLIYCGLLMDDGECGGYLANC